MTVTSTDRLHPTQGLLWTKILARDLLDVKTVSSVELFGAYARREAVHGSVFNIIVIVDDDTASHWAFAVDYDAGNNDWCEPLVTQRRIEWAGHYLGDEAMMAGWDGILDIYLLPASWRTNLSVLQATGHHSNAHFMDELARDAIRFDSDLGEWNFGYSSETPES